MIGALRLAGAATVEPAPWWATLVAALLGGLIGSAIAAGVAIWTGRTERAHDKLMRKEESDAEHAGRQRQERYEAYSRLLAASMMVAHTVGVMRLAMQVRSGLGEGIDIALRVRKPLDPFEVGNHLRSAFEPLFEAGSHIGVIGSKEAIRKANRVLDAAVDVLGTGTTRGQATEGFARWLLGEKWTAPQMEEFLGKTRVLGEARRQFAIVARQELGSEVADLFLRDDTAAPAETSRDTIPSSGSVKQAPR